MLSAKQGIHWYHFYLFIFLYLGMTRSGIKSAIFRSRSESAIFRSRSGRSNHYANGTVLNASLHYSCNEQPSQATANPVGGKACSSTKGGLLRYILNTYSIHKVSSLKICILQALNMPLIRCTNVFQREAIPSHSLVAFLNNRLLAE